MRYIKNGCQKSIQGLSPKINPETVVPVPMPNPGFETLKRCVEPRNIFTPDELEFNTQDFIFIECRYRSF